MADGVIGETGPFAVLAVGEALKSRNVCVTTLPPHLMVGPVMAMTRGRRRVGRTRVQVGLLTCEKANYEYIVSPSVLSGYPPMSHPHLYGTAHE